MPFALDEDRLRAHLERRVRRELDPEGLRRSAVLVPLFRRDGAWHVLLTRRTDAVGSHKGQISFPGGRQEPGDVDLLETALRETEEEVGLERGDVRVLGPLDDITTLRTDRITPYLAVVPHPYAFRPAADEVAYLLELPLAAFLEPERLRTEHLPYPDGTRRDVYFYHFEAAGREEVVWGATARILKEWLDWMAHWRGVDIPRSDT